MVLTERQLRLIISAILAIVAIGGLTIAVHDHYSDIIYDLESRVDELERESAFLREDINRFKIDAEAKEKYFDFVVKLLSEGDVAFADIKSFLPAGEVTMIQEQTRKHEGLI